MKQIYWDDSTTIKFLYFISLSEQVIFVWCRNKKIISPNCTLLEIWKWSRHTILTSDVVVYIGTVVEIENFLKLCSKCHKRKPSGTVIQSREGQYFFCKRWTIASARSWLMKERRICFEKHRYLHFSRWIKFYFDPKCRWH